MAKPLARLRARMDPARSARPAEAARALLAELPLHQLRQVRDLTQQQLAQDLDITQPEVSRLEHRTDLYLSTLRRYIEALGGGLEILARFPDGTVVRVGRFGEGEDPAARRPPGARRR